MDSSGFLLELFIGGLLLAIGYWLGLRQTRVTREEEQKDDYERVINSIFTEIVINNEILEKGTGTAKTLRGNDVEWFSSTLLTDAYQSAMNAGHLGLLKPEQQAVLAFYYQAVENLNSVGMPPPFEGWYDRSLESIKVQIEKLIEIYAELLIMFEVEVE